MLDHLPLQPPTGRPSASRAWRWVFPLLLAVGACSDSTPAIEGSHPGIERLVWESAPQQPEVGPQLEPRVVLHWEPSPDASEDPLSVEDAQHTLASIVNDEGRSVPTLRVQPSESGRLRIRGPFELFDRVTITLATEQTILVRPRLWSEGKMRSSVLPSRFEASAVPVTLCSDMPRAHFVPGSFDELTLDLVRQTAPVDIVSIELIQRPLSDWIGPRLGEVDLVFLGRDARRATPLSSARPLRASSQSLPDGAAARLRLCIGDPPDGRMPWRPKTLRLEIERGSTLLKEELTIRPEPWTNATEWHEFEFELPPDKGAVQVRATLESLKEGEAVLALGEPTLVVPQAQSPTVLIVTSDTHRADYLGVSGGAVETPFLDQLAQRGVRFTNASAPVNLTRPSHAGLFTGVAPRDMGLVTNFERLAEEAPTLAEAFRDAGWRTCAATSARKMRPADSGLGQGFDRMFAPLTSEGQIDSAQTLENLDLFLEEAEGAPLFCWVHVFDAHTPYDPPTEFTRLYYPADRDPYDQALPNLEELVGADWDRGLRDLDYIVNLYAGEITYLDQQLEQTLSRARWKNSIVAFLGDHGESLTENGSYFRHETLYPVCVRIPLILAAPGLTGDRRVTTPVTHLDVGRTLLDLAGLREHEFPGRNLIEDFQAADARFAISSEATECSVQVQDLLLILNLETRVRAGVPNPPRHSLELYDLAQDPACATNLVAERPEDVARLRAALVAWLLAPIEKEWAVKEAISDPQLLEQLAKLGYLAPDPERSEWLDPECSCEFCAEYAR